MFPLHQGTLLRHWMVYRCAWPPSSHGCRWINWNWTQIKLNSSLLGANDSGAVCSSCYYCLQDLQSICRYLNLDSAKLLATGLVSSRLEYCNSPVYRIVDTDHTKLQRVQNWLTRVVTKSPPFTHSVPLFRSLHWLPVKFRILFKTNLLTCETFHEKQPVYLHSKLATSLPSHSLRSSKRIKLSVPRVKTNTGARAFHSCAWSRWDNLPLSVHSAISVATF